MMARCISEAWNAAGKHLILQANCTGVLMSRDPGCHIHHSSLFLALTSFLLLSFVSALFICLYLSFSLINQGSNAGILFLSASIIFGFYSFKVMFPAEKNMINPPSIFGVGVSTTSSPNKQLNTDAQKARSDLTPL